MRALHLVVFILGVMVIFPVQRALSQVAITSDGTSPDASAMLDVKSTTIGMAIPRMTAAQIGAIASPVNGLQAFNTDNGKIYIYLSLSGVWKEASFKLDRRQEFSLSEKPTGVYMVHVSSGNITETQKIVRKNN
jgi:hypothetical protein